MSLEKIFARQLDLQRAAYGLNPEFMDDETRAAYIRDMVLACTDELHEALGEVGWKPWQTSRHLHHEAFGKELVDALHFLVNLWLAAGWTAEDVEAAYFRKADRNHARQLEGYDGVDGKCSHCHRALDEPS